LRNDPEAQPQKIPVHPGEPQFGHELPEQLAQRENCFAEGQKCKHIAVRGVRIAWEESVSLKASD
jgi:hypothetical protein